MRGWPCAVELFSTMTPDFLDAIRDGAPVTLAFYFWSGAKTTYTVTESGTTITGSPA
jgi:endoglucanase